MHAHVHTRRRRQTQIREFRIREIKTEPAPPLQRKKSSRVTSRRMRSGLPTGTPTRTLARTRTRTYTSGEEQHRETAKTRGRLGVTGCLIDTDNHPQKNTRRKKADVKSSDGKTTIVSDQLTSDLRWRVRQRERQAADPS